VAELHRAVLDDDANARGVLKDAHVGERVAVDHDEVGALALHQRAELVLDAEALGGEAGGSPASA